ncbi:MAG: DinB family protein [bacterium]
MSMVEHYHRLCAYDAWANREVLAFFKQAAAPPPRALRFFAHVLAAEFLWLNRMENEKQELAVWPEFSLAECETHLARLAAKWQTFMKNLTAARLAHMVVYKNTKGEDWSSTVNDILTHVFMHAAYHRGQIATAMRDAGHIPAYTDFIHAVRSGSVK